MEKKQEEKKPEEKKEEEIFQIGEVATQVEPVIVNTKTKDQYNILTALCKVMNDIEDLKGLL